MRRRILSLVPLALVLVLVVGCVGQPAATPAPTAAPAAAPTAAPTALPATAVPEPTATSSAPTELILATTTSTADSGLLDYLLPDFEAKYNATVSVVAVGSGQAMKLGEDGNADVLLVHSPAAEEAFMEAGHGTRREDVMYNDFVIVGPKDDPAGIAGLTDVAEAMSKIATSGATFISRGDESGTHAKEKTLWAATDIEPTGDWYVSAGQGMGDVLTMTEEQQAYTLSDRATYLARSLEGIDLVILVEGDPRLFNPYGVIAVNPAKGPHIKADLANAFIDWIISVPTQELIGKFGVEEFGAPLFTPDSALWRAQSGAAEAPAAEAALVATGRVAAETSWTLEQLGAMEQVEATVTSKSGETTTYQGASLVALLTEAGIAADATTVTLVASDGYTVDVAWAELKECANCIVAVQDAGTLRSALTDFPGNTSVKGLAELRVQ